MGKACSTCEMEEQCVHSFGRKLKRAKRIGRSKIRCKGNMKMGLEVIGREGVDFIHLP
jgi:hypothetical protein